MVYADLVAHSLQFTMNTPPRAALAASLILNVFSGALFAQGEGDDPLNLSFENEALGALDVPKQWTFPKSNTVALIIEEDPPSPESGSRSLIVDYSQAVETDFARSFLSEPISIDPTRDYTQSFWLKTDGPAEGGFGVSVGRLNYDAEMKPIKPDIYADRYLIANASNSEWRKYSVRLVPSGSEKFNADTIPAAARYVRLLFLSYNYNRRYSIDDLRFEVSP